MLGTAAVGSVSLGDLGGRQEDALHRLLQSALPAVLEIGSAAKSAEAWEVEAGLAYDESAWFLYDELWDLSARAAPGLSPRERRDQIELLIDPLLDTTVADGERAAIAIEVFRAVLAARMVALLDAG